MIMKNGEVWAVAVVGFVNVRGLSVTLFEAEFIFINLIVQIFVDAFSEKSSLWDIHQKFIG